MKRTIIILTVLTATYFLLSATLSGLFNPKSVEIGIKRVNFPDKMHLQEVFHGKNRLGVLDLLLKDEPYHLDYPDKGMLIIRFSNKENSSMLMLMPSLTKNTFEMVTKAKGKLKNKCMTVKNEGKTYLLNVEDNKGYVILSGGSLATTFISNQLCK